MTTKEGDSKPWDQDFFMWEKAHGKDCSFMIAELIPAWTADAIHFLAEKEIVCGYHDPKVKSK